MTRDPNGLWFLALAALMLAGCPSKTGPSIVDTEEEDCTSSDDCSGGFECIEGACEPANCRDGVQNQDETDVDCGGVCSPCMVGQSCDDELDCSFACAGGVCVDRDDPSDMGTPDPDGGGGDATLPDGGEGDSGTPMGECQDPGDTQRFVRWTESGLDRAGQSADVGSDFGAGIGIADFDGDGDPDVLTGESGKPLLLINDGGTFSEATAGSGLDALTDVTAIGIADIDGDGDSDLYLGRLDGQYLMLNDGDGTFTDATDAWGLGGSSPAVSGANFVDFDGDGDLDLYVSRWARAEGFNFVSVPNILYRNDGAAFTQLTTSPGGAGAEGKTNASTWWDFDGDLDPDLLVGNDFGPVDRGDQLYRNDGADPNDPDGWVFTDISAQANFDTELFTMSTTVADFDNDLDLDVYLANFGYNVLHVVEGGTATDEAVQRGVGVGHLADPIPRPAEDPDFDLSRGVGRMDAFLNTYTDPSLGQYVLTSWASVFFDADHDGWQDLWVVNGMVISEYVPEATNQPNYMHFNQGDGTFERAPCWYRPDVRGSSRSSAVGDLDMDGDLDILFTDTGLNASEPGLYALRNDDGAGNWLIVELEGAAPNTDAIGARVTVNAGGNFQVRHIDGGQGFVSVHERIAHFGLADAATVDSIEVRWPDGTTTTQSDVAANQRLTIAQ